MFVAATTDCFPELSLKDSLTRLVDLEYTCVEIKIHEQNGDLKPSLVSSDIAAAVEICTHTQRLDVIAYSVDIEAEGGPLYDHFDACCKLAKATKVATLVVPAAHIGTPFNEEVERLRRLVYIAGLHGVRVSIKSETGRVSEDPDTVCVLCKNAPGLGLSLDPSHYICGPHSGRNIDRLMQYVHHVQLRDTSKDELQVRVGQGEIEYGKLIAQLRQVGYQCALTVDIRPMEGVDHQGEMRKMRLLLESLLL